jgi:hypothetical protein
MGAPKYPSRKQVEELMDASRLRRDPLPVEGIEGTLHVTLDLPAHAVAILTIEDACPPGGSSAARVGGP